MEHPGDLPSGKDSVARVPLGIGTGAAGRAPYISSDKTTMTISTEQTSDADREALLRPLRVMHVFGGRILSGVETSILTLSAGQRDHVDEVVLVPLAEGSFDVEARRRGFTVDPLNKRCRYDVAQIPKLARMIKRHRIDLVHSHAVNGAFYACPAGRLARVRAQVCHFRAPTAASLEDVYRWNLLRVLADKYHRWLTRWCQRLITVSPALRDELIRDGVPPEKVVYVPNETNLSTYDRSGAAREAIRAEFRMTPDLTVIGTVARLAAFKNIPLLLRAAKPLTEAHDDVRLVIVGDGPDRPALERMARDLGIDQKVYFAGWRNDVARVLSAFDLFALPSRTEGMPNTVMEAMALGKPVVATDVGGVAELVKDEETGLLVPSDDLERFTGALSRMLEDRQFAGRVASAGREFIEKNHNGSTVAGRVLDVYVDLLKNR